MVQETADNARLRVLSCNITVVIPDLVALALMNDQGIARHNCSVVAVEDKLCGTSVRRPFNIRRIQFRDNIAMLIGEEVLTLQILVEYRF